MLPLPANNVLAPSTECTPPEWQPAGTTSRQSTFADLTKHVNGHLSAVQLYFAANRKRAHPDKPNDTEPALQYPLSAPENLDIISPLARVRVKYTTREIFQDCSVDQRGIYSHG